MRIAALIIAILGSLAAGGFAISVLTDSRTARLEKSIAEAKALGKRFGSNGFAAKAAAKAAAAAQSAIRGAYALIGAFLLGLVGGVFAFRGKGLIAGPLILLGALIPGFFQPLYFVITALLFVSGGLAFFAKPKQGSASPRPAVA